jgi:hypothetical protein
MWIGWIRIRIRNTVNDILVELLVEVTVQQLYFHFFGISITHKVFNYN